MHKEKMLLVTAAYCNSCSRLELVSANTLAQTDPGMFGGVFENFRQVPLPPFSSQAEVLAYHVSHMSMPLLMKAKQEIACSLLATIVCHLYIFLIQNCRQRPKT